ncbi:MAG: fibrillarin-like rRNA/tRNA 2'-O-methyltransferase [Thermoplasmatota archaeon]
MEQLFPGVFRHHGRLYTRNLVPGVAVYGEPCCSVDGVEYRSWNPYKSKLAAAVSNGLKKVPLNEGSRVLYLGAATGTTVSHVSDIVISGAVYAVEKSERAMRKLVALCRQRDNVVPVLADARQPRGYEHYLAGTPDLLYQDISQQDQVDIFLKNMAFFSPAWGLLMVKARSIDVAARPGDVFRAVARSVGECHRIRQQVILSPFSKDHVALLVNGG